MQKFRVCKCINIYKKYFKVLIHVILYNTIYYIFFEPYYIFYEFYKFIRISEIIQKKQNFKILVTQCWAALWPDFRPLAWPSGPASPMDAARPARGHSGAVGPGSPTDKVRWGRRREHRGGGGHQPDKVTAAQTHPSGGSTVRREKAASPVALQQCGDPSVVMGGERGALTWRSTAGTGSWLTGAGRRCLRVQRGTEQGRSDADERALATVSVG
jgi:hypothetical protein